MKEAIQTHFEMPLDELLNDALNIEQAAVNPGTDAEGNSNTVMLKRPKLPYQDSKGVVKAKHPRNMEVSPLPFLMIKKDQLALPVVK
jgi:hypothetical protein